MNNIETTLESIKSEYNSYLDEFISDINRLKELSLEDGKSKEIRQLYAALNLKTQRVSTYLTIFNKTRKGQ